MYLDTKGVVTCANGHALFSSAEACLLKWMHSDGRIATSYEISAVWSAVKTGVRQNPELFLDFDEVKRVLALDMQRFIVGTTKEFPDVYSYPDSAQVAIYDMVFQCGSLYKWPRLTKAVLAQDWNTAACESNRPDAGQIRNADTYDQFMAAIS